MAGGPRVPTLAASYAAERGLEVVVVVLDHERFPRDAVERRDAAVVAEADAAVVVRDDRNASVQMILRLVEQRGIALHVIDDQPLRKGKPVATSEVSQPRGLPD